jgi:serine/threonine protein kinase
LNEQIDVWSLGNNFYALLTGVSPFPEMETTTPVKKALKAKKTAYIDPRWKDQSFPERKLAEIIPRCWIFNPDERITINELVAFLKDAVEEYEKILERETEQNEPDSEHLLHPIKSGKKAKK